MSSRFIRHSPHRSSIWAIVVFLFLTIPSGCSEVGTTDVTNDPAYGFSGVVGTWKTKTPLWVKSVNGTMYLEVNDMRYNLPTQILAVVPVGTEIRIEHLIDKKTIETEFITPTGSLTTGPYAGKTLTLDERLFSPNYFKHANVDTTTRPAVLSNRMWAVSPDKLGK